LHIKTPITTIKLNEKMITKSDATMAIIISANSEIGNPKIIARFLMFL
jgi:hypothetical protein